MINGFVNLGHGRAVAYHRVVAIMPYDSSPAKRLVSTANGENKFLDFTGGKERKSVIVIDNESVIVSAINPDTLVKRFNSSRAELLRIEPEETPTKGKRKKKKSVEGETPVEADDSEEENTPEGDIPS